MKRKLTVFTKLGFLLVSALLIFSACTEEKYYPTVYPEGDFAYVKLIDRLTINQNQWRWNDYNGRYEVSIPFSNLDENDYDVGMVVGNIFVLDENNKEYSTPLPFIRTWYKGNYPYVETISCAISYNKKNIEFYIESSDKDLNSGEPNTYEFKIALIYNFTY